MVNPFSILTFAFNKIKTFLHLEYEKNTTKNTINDMLYYFSKNNNFIKSEQIILDMIYPNDKKKRNEEKNC